jgi:hypothetical protein
MPHVYTPESLAIPPDVPADYVSASDRVQLACMLGSIGEAFRTDTTPEARTSALLVALGNAMELGSADALRWSEVCRIVRHNLAIEAVPGLVGGGG